MPRSGSCCSCFTSLCGSKHLRVASFENPPRILIVGLDGAGKTSIAACLEHIVPEYVAPTVGFSTTKISTQKYTAVLFDLGGCENFRGIWPRYFAEVHGVIMVIDSSGNERYFTKVKTALEGVANDNRIKGKPILLFANKADLKDSKTPEEIIKDLDFRPDFFSPSCAIAKTIKEIDPRIDESFDKFMKEIYKEYEDLEDKIAADLLVQKQEEEVERKERIKRITERKAKETKEALEQKNRNESNIDYRNEESKSTTEPTVNYRTIEAT